MKPIQCRKGNRIVATVFGQERHGVVSAVIVVGVGDRTKVREIMVRWDGFPGSMSVDPADLRPEPRVPVESREKLERWLDA